MGIGSAALWFLVGYVVGAVPIGVLVSRLRGIDIRHYGTGNIGASNVIRNVGLVPGVIVGVATFLQGLVPAGAAALLTRSPVDLAAAGVGSVLGYGWSFLLHFHGGRAVGTATGALAVIAPLGLIPLLGLYAIGGILHRPAPGVLLGLIAFLVFIAVRPHPLALLVASALIVAAIVLKRLEGIQDDLRGSGGRPVEILFDRLVFDRRPGQRLVGRNG